MPRKIYKPEEIVAKLRQVDVLTSQGRTTSWGPVTTASRPGPRHLCCAAK